MLNDNKTKMAIRILKGIPMFIHGDTVCRKDLPERKWRIVEICSYIEDIVIYSDGEFRHCTAEELRNKYELCLNDKQ